MDPEERALIDQVCADPDDDAPRLVYGDWLLARGDPRGELIALQCARRPLSSDEQAQVRALVAAHGQRWLGDLAGGEARAVAFARGFASEVVLDYWSPRLLASVDIATVQTLRGAGDNVMRLLRDHAPRTGVGLASLRTLSSVSPAEVAELADGPVRPLREVVVGGRRTRSDLIRRLHPGLPGVIRLHLTGPAQSWDLDREVFAQLRQLRAHAGAQARAWLTRVLALAGGLERLELFDARGDQVVETILVSGAARLSRLELRSRPPRRLEPNAGCLPWIVAALPPGLVREVIVDDAPAAVLDAALAPLGAVVRYQYAAP